MKFETHSKVSLRRWACLGDNYSSYHGVEPCLYGRWSLCYSTKSNVRPKKFLCFLLPSVP